MLATIILICLTFGGLLISLVKHGESKGNYNFASALFAVIVNFALFYYAGLFDKLIH